MNHVYNQKLLSVEDVQEPGDETKAEQRSCREQRRNQKKIGKRTGNLIHKVKSID